MRADTAVRPYSEDLSLNRHSRVREKSCRGRLPRLPARHDNRNAKRASTEACPYAELVNIAQTKSNKPARQRDVRWDVECEGRETKVEQPTEVKKVCTGDFDTSVRHPPRERIDSLISNSVPREGVEALTYAETSMNKFNKIGWYCESYLITRKQNPNIRTTNITVHSTRHKTQPGPRKENR